MTVTTMLAKRKKLVGVTLAVALAVSAAPSLAQGLDSEGAIDTIVGSDVTTGEETVGADEERILAAIDESVPNAAEVRRKFSLDKVEIIFLPDIDEEGSAVQDKLGEMRAELLELRQAIEGSAMFYHAIDSRRIMLNSVVALEFDEENGVVIFVAGEDTTP